MENFDFLTGLENYSTSEVKGIIQEIIEVANEEIDTTSKEAVKENTIQLLGENAYLKDQLKWYSEKSLSDMRIVDRINKTKIRDQIITGVISGGVGVLLTILIANIL